jgi:hypothetical protein
MFIEVLELKSPIRATFLEKFECVINSSSNCKKASSEEYGENSGGM